MAAVFDWPLSEKGKRRKRLKKKSNNNNVKDLVEEFVGRIPVKSLQ